MAADSEPSGMSALSIAKDEQDTKSVEAQIGEAEALDDDPPVPDGGFRAWLVIAGAFVLSCATFGYVVSWGTFQEYYETGPLQDRSASDIAWIGSLQYSLVYLPGLVTGRIFDLGIFRPSMIGSSVVYIVSNFLIAECRLYWHFVLCQGVALGLSAGWIYIPCIAVGAHWFKKKRPIAFSIVALGASLGGILFPIVFRQLLPKIGFRWTVRVMAFMNLACFLFANLTIKPRFSPKGRTAIRWQALAKPPFILYTFSTFLSFLGLYTLLTFISVSAVAIGIDSSLAFYLVSVCNATSGFGRLLGGALAVKYGGLNVMIVFTALASVLTYIWPFVKSHGGFTAVVCLYGVASGAFAGLFALVATRLGSLEDVGLRIGVQMTIMSLGALAGPPISGAILTNTGSFHQVGIYAGSMIIGSVVVMILARRAQLGSFVGGVF